MAQLMITAPCGPELVGSQGGPWVICTTRGRYRAPVLQIFSFLLRPCVDVAQTHECPKSLGRQIFWGRTQQCGVLHAAANIQPGFETEISFDRLRFCSTHSACATHTRAPNIVTIE